MKRQLSLSFIDIPAGMNYMLTNHYPGLILSESSRHMHYQYHRIPVFTENFSQSHAVLDRLLHHSTVISINGPSYRLKDKLLVDETTGKSGK